METFKIKLYTCGCGYKTTDSGSASKHKKTSCGQWMTSESKVFLLEEEVSKCNKNTHQHVEEKKRVEELIKENNTLRRILIDREICDYSDSDKETSTGIIYYIVDKELPTRAKIGRTADMNIKKLKTRYSTFGDPLIVCFISTDIKTDEKKLKEAMKAAKCINTERGKESIHHSEFSLAVFHKFAIQSQ
ncbi:protein of unknown function (DUF1390) [Paramecium bursaria Chlorella virus NE-JV-4]|nr:protein of unknown function (DUF1390) [Paramecium bursaria Chlorella virus NE-JV-4]